MDQKKLKKFSIRFGIICGIVITATSAFNAVLGSVQKWNDTFEKTEDTFAMVAPDDLSSDERIEYPEDSLEADVEEIFKEPISSLIRENPLPPPPPEPILAMAPEDDIASGSFFPKEEKNWFSIWFITLVLGIGIWYVCYRMGRKLARES